MSLPKGRTNNPNGRPKRPEIEQIREAIAAVEKTKKKSLWLHLIERCYESDIVLVAVSKKFVPDKISADVKVDDYDWQGKRDSLLKSLEEFIKNKNV